MHLFEFVPVSQLVEGEPRHRRSIYRSAYLDIRLREESAKGRRGLLLSLVKTSHDSGSRTRELV